MGSVALMRPHKGLEIPGACPRQVPSLACEAPRSGRGRGSGFGYCVSNPHDCLSAGAVGLCERRNSFAGSQTLPDITEPVSSMNS